MLVFKRDLTRSEALNEIQRSFNILLTRYGASGTINLYIFKVINFRVFPMVDDFTPVNFRKGLSSALCKN